MPGRLPRRMMCCAVILLPALVLAPRDAAPAQTGRIGLQGFTLVGRNPGEQGDLEIHNTGSIVGQLVLSPTFPGAPNGRGIPGRIDVLDRQGGVMAQAEANAYGVFLIYLPAGTYVLRLISAEPPGYAADRAVTVVAGGVTNVVIPVQPRAGLTYLLQEEALATHSPALAFLQLARAARRA